MPNDVNSLAHTKWNCKYHIVFAQSTEGRCSLEKKEKQLEKF